METSAAPDTTPIETPNEPPRRTLSVVQDEVAGFANKSRAQFTEVQARATQSVDGATRVLGKRMISVGESIVRGGKLTGFRVRRLGKYLDRTSPADMMRDVGSWAEENPRLAGAAVAGGALAFVGMLGKMRS